jgi:predicted HicB family RNase H-like nuclease
MSLKVEKHKGYIGTYEPDTDSNGFYGKIAFITDLVTFSGETRKELQASFNEAVDDYLAFCEDIGKEPKKSFNGVFQVRTTPVLHERASIYAIENNIEYTFLCAPSWSWNSPQLCT